MTKLCSVFVLCVLLSGQIALAQTDRGSISGIVVDATGAKIPNVKVVATRTETQTVYQTTTTSTGNYTLPSLQVGTYTLTFEATGFDKSVENGIILHTVEELRINATLQVGATTQTVVVTSASPMMQADSAQISDTVSTQTVESIPLSYVGGGVQNPTNFASLQPGATAGGGGNFQVRVNGEPPNTYKTLVDGQDITNGIDASHLAEETPSQESLQETTLQTSNYSAEFGQVAGGLFNFTSKSGTNYFHGVGYEHWVNEVLNAGNPYTNNGSGGLVRPQSRKNDFGLAVGGPIILPKLYNGRDKSFFFFNLEYWETTSTDSGSYGTVPTAAFRSGDFSAALTGKQLGVDPLGRPIMENEIYDPLTTRTVNGQIVRDPFPGNIIPPSRFDAVAAKIQALIPPATNTNVINDFAVLDHASQTMMIPSVKIDQNFGANTKISFYWSEFRHDEPKASQDGLPWPISPGRTQTTRTNIFRLNLDKTLTSNLFLHTGIGETRYLHSDSAPPSVLDYNAAANLGLTGCSIPSCPFPEITGLASISGEGFSDTADIGLTNAGSYTENTPTVVGSLTWARGNHSYKAGGEWREDLWTDKESVATGGVYNFASQETGLPYLQESTLNGGDVGFPYASFLLGQADTASVRSREEPNVRKYGYGIFAQDTWKATSKLTLDYGIRYDYQQAYSESKNRLSEFAPSIPNPSAGGLLGATAYQANGKFTKTYPYAIGPRLGVAYQITTKTILRGGWGIVYSETPGTQYFTGTPIIGTGWNTIPFSGPSFGIPGAILQNGLQYPSSELTNACFCAGIVPNPGQINPPPYYIDPEAGRPSRTMQYNVTVQRQLAPRTALEASYVGNRAVWLQSDMMDLNANTAGIFAEHGLDITNPANEALLLSPMNSPQVQSAGFVAPYSGFPTGLTLAQALRPYPQFSAISTLWPMRGNTWYDGLQLKLTQRAWRGLTGTVGYTFQKELSLGAVAPGGGSYTSTLVNDVFNRPANKTISSLDQPQVLDVGANYVSPAVSDNKLVRVVAKGWTIGTVLIYSSGYPISAPYSNNNLNALLLRNTSVATFENRVPGVPLFLKNLNCHCINPYTQLTLNPAAWKDAAPGTFGTTPIFMNDYRYRRRPSEALSLGRMVNLPREKAFELRMEFFNPFNRTNQADPSNTNAQATATTGTAGYTGGFGWINPAASGGGARTGQLTARFEF
jgi:hypothetical protein